MNVKLISVTQAPEMSPEELIVCTARVSNPENQYNHETAPRLINYLIKHKHWSPFEMVDMTVEIETSRGIAQQILRHRSFSFQEFSQRYSSASKIEPIELRRSGATNRQSSTDAMDSDEAIEAVDLAITTCLKAYKDLLEIGVARECARFVLPIATQTRIYMKGSIRSWIHYLQIRTDEHTQLEHRLIAMEIQKVFNELFPNISKALNHEKTTM